MPRSSQRVQSIDQYIATFQDDIQKILQLVRDAVHRAAPDVEEAIHYQMPAFRVSGTYLVYFSGWKKHIGMYPVPTGPEEFVREIRPYLAARSTVRFPLSGPIPYPLIEELVRLRRTEIEAGV